MLNITFVFILSIFFLVSGISKLFAIKSFKETLILLRFPEKYSSYFAFFFAFTELIVATGILVDSYRSYFLFIMLLIIISLILITTLSIKNNQRIKCNCFGNLTDESFGMGVLFKILIMLLMVLYLLFNGGYIWGSNYNEIILLMLISVQVFLSYIALVSINNLNKPYRK